MDLTDGPCQNPEEQQRGIESLSKRIDSEESTIVSVLDDEYVVPGYQEATKAIRNLYVAF